MLLPSTIPIKYKPAPMATARKADKPPFGHVLQSSAFCKPTGHFNIQQSNELTSFDANQSSAHWAQSVPEKPTKLIYRHEWCVKCVITVGALSAFPVYVAVAHGQGRLTNGIELTRVFACSSIRACRHGDSSLDCSASGLLLNKVCIVTWL